MDAITSYHNPRCSKSRQTLELIRAKGLEPTVILYLESPPSAAELADMLTKLDKRPADITRKTEPEYKSFFGHADQLEDSAYLSLMSQYPKTIERPIVVKGDKAVIGRPPELVLSLLD